MAQSQFQLLAASVFDESTDTQVYDEAYYNDSEWIPVTASVDDFISVNSNKRRCLYFFKKKESKEGN